MKVARISGYLFLLLAVLGSPLVAASQPAPEPVDEDPPLVEITQGGRGRYVDLFAKNLTGADVTLVFGAELTNAESVADLPLTVTLAPHARVQLTRIVPILIEKEWEYSYVYLPAYGDPDTVHDEKYLYRFPFPTGKRYRVGQTFGGKYTHNKEAYYSVDFDMPIGSKVCAARDGLVVDVKESSDVGGQDPKLENDANHVIVRHSDRTLAMYAHFKQDGVFVAAGDSVARGQVIGLSGNTGYSSGPHLHFSVHTLMGDHGETCAVRFDSADGPVVLPREGRAYTARDRIVGEAGDPAEAGN